MRATVHNPFTGTFEPIKVLNRDPRRLAGKAKLIRQQEQKDRQFTNAGSSPDGDEGKPETRQTRRSLKRLPGEDNAAGSQQQQPGPGQPSSDCKAQGPRLRQTQHTLPAEGVSAALQHRPRQGKDRQGTSGRTVSREARQTRHICKPSGGTDAALLTQQTCRLKPSGTQLQHKRDPRDAAGHHGRPRQPRFTRSQADPPHEAMPEQNSNSAPPSRGGWRHNDPRGDQVEENRKSKRQRTNDSCAAAAAVQSLHEVGLTLPDDCHMIAQPSSTRPHGIRTGRNGSVHRAAAEQHSQPVPPSKMQPDARQPKKRSSRRQHMMDGMGPSEQPQQRARTRAAAGPLTRGLTHDRSTQRVRFQPKSSPAHAAARRQHKAVSVLHPHRSSRDILKTRTSPALQGQVLRSARPGPRSRMAQRSLKLPSILCSPADISAHGPQSPTSPNDESSVDGVSQDDEARAGGRRLGQSMSSPEMPSPKVTCTRPHAAQGSPAHASCPQARRMYSLNASTNSPGFSAEGQPPQPNRSHALQSPSHDDAQRLGRPPPHAPKLGWRPTQAWQNQGCRFQQGSCSGCPATFKEDCESCQGRPVLAAGVGVWQQERQAWF